MKAILILFSGDYVCVDHEKEVIAKIADIVNLNNTSKSIEISEFNDKDISKLLMSNLIESTLKRTSKEDKLKKFCNILTTELGDPKVYSNENNFKITVITTLLSKKIILEENADVVNHLIFGKLNDKELKILKEKSFQDIPQYLKEINSICKLF